MSLLHDEQPWEAPELTAREVPSLDPHYAPVERIIPDMDTQYAAIVALRDEIVKVVNNQNRILDCLTSLQVRVDLLEKGGVAAQLGRLQ